MKKLAFTGILLLSLCLFSSNELKSQTSAQAKKISGTVSCSSDSIMLLSYVNIYNLSSKKGTTTDTEGYFEIEMNKSDTILFSTVQHQEYYYYLVDEVVPDKKINIELQQDTVYLEVVNIMGYKSYSQFKEELFQLDLSENDVSIAYPVIDKYARQYASGDGAFEIKGPLTYLSKKIGKLKERGLFK
ncbi:carboxypeptidase-like regulatory domain-containing protein [bacterium]|nr:carboxypeptidase-like regulatory domain-containing protein [bacterium]